MGKCVLCDEFLPPWFMEIDEEDETKPNKCLFCINKMGTSNDNDELTLDNEVYTKKAVKEEYKIYMKKLIEKNKEEIIKKLTKPN